MTECLAEIIEVELHCLLEVIAADLRVWGQHTMEEEEEEEDWPESGEHEPPAQSCGAIRAHIASVVFANPSLSKDVIRFVSSRPKFSSKSLTSIIQGLY